MIITEAAKQISMLANVNTETEIWIEEAITEILIKQRDEIEKKLTYDAEALAEQMYTSGRERDKCREFAHRLLVFFQQDSQMVMVCAVDGCGLEDDTGTAYCSRHGRSIHKMVKQHQQDKDDDKK